MTKQDPTTLSTKDKIAVAALTVLSERGLAKASIKEIAKEAGVPPGLVHYHFSTKDELLAKVVTDLSSEFYEEMSALRAKNEPKDFLLVSLKAVKTRIQKKTYFYRARFESYPLGLSAPDMQETIRNIFSEARVGITKSAELSGFNNEINQLPIANIILACFDGLALQYMIDPDFGIDAAFDELIDMLDNHRSHLIQ